MADGLTDYLVPVEGLAIAGAWQIGPVHLLDLESARSFIMGHPSMARELYHPLEPPFISFADTLSAVTALTRAESSHAAVALVRAALELIRVYQQSRARVRTSMFGLPGEVESSSISFMTLGGKPGVGTIGQGHVQGWTFRPEDVSDFAASPGFSFAAHALANPDKDEAARRAVLAVSIASRAVLDHRPGNRLLYAVMAAEVLLLDRSTQAQSYRLARRSAYFLCGLPERSLCGRDRPTCPALGNSPDESTGRRKLAQFRNRGNADARWRCSEWHHVLDWYDDRSDIVHGGELASDDNEADRAVFWLVTHLLPAVLDWLAAHPDDPIGDLEIAILELPEPPDWDSSP